MFVDDGHNHGCHQRPGTMMAAIIAPESVDYIEGNVPSYWAEVQLRGVSNFKFGFDLVDATASFRAHWQWFARWD